MNIKNKLRTALFMFLVTTLATSAFAEHKEGAIIGMRNQPVGGGHQMRLYVYVDTIGNKIADTVLVFFDPRTNSTSANLEMFIERGMSVIFDDEGFFIENDMKMIGGSNKTIDDINMLDLFPNEEARFKFAAEAKRKAAAGQQNTR
jgi:hypothetical protein